MSLAPKWNHCSTTSTSTTHHRGVHHSDCGQGFGHLDHHNHTGTGDQQEGLPLGRAAKRLKPPDIYLSAFPISPHISNIYSISYIAFAYVLAENKGEFQRWQMDHILSLIKDRLCLAESKTRNIEMNIIYSPESWLWIRLNWESAANQI